MQRDPLGYPDGMNSFAAYHAISVENDHLGLALSISVSEGRAGSPSPNLLPENHAEEVRSYVRQSVNISWEEPTENYDIVEISYSIEGIGWRRELEYNIDRVFRFGKFPSTIELALSPEPGFIPGDVSRERYQIQWTERNTSNTTGIVKFGVR